MTTDIIELTGGQVRYLDVLEETGQISTQDLVFKLMVSGNSISKAMKALRELGLVESVTTSESGRGRRYVHRLTSDYRELRKKAILKKNAVRSEIREEHILYAAMLKNDLKTGRDLEDIFMKLYPEKTKHAVHNIITKAKARRLCR